MTVAAAIRRFSPELRGETRYFVVAGLLLTVAAIAEVVGIFVLSDVIDSALGAHGVVDFIRLATLWLGITALSTGADYLGQVISVGISERVVLRLRDRVFAHLQRLSPDTHRRFGIGDLVTRATGDLDAVEHLIGSGIMQLSIAVLSTLTLVTVAFVMSWQVALVAVLAVPALWAVSAVYGRRQSDATWDERTASSDIASGVHRALSGHETAVAFNQQAREHDALHREGISWMRARLAQTRVEVGFGSVLGMAQIVVTLAITVTGVWQVRSGALSIGELIALTGFLGMLYPKMQEIAEVRLSVAAATVSAERIAEILDSPAHHRDTDGAIDFVGAGTDVDVEHVTFRRGETPVLDDVSLSLRPGRVVALVGESGSGKTTLASLLTRIERPDAGRVLLDGVDIADVTASSVRDRITVLPQQPTIKPMTVAENIAYGRPGADLESIVDAAVAADAHSFIIGLRDGYDTELHEDGVTLSGGQRQRIAMARAFLRDSPVLVLDEPTAALDEATARRILEPLRRLASGRSTLLITHDPLVMAIADDVFELPRTGLRDPHPDRNFVA